MNEKYKVIAAVRDDLEFKKALDSHVSTIFFLYADIMELKSIALRAHKVAKKVYIHIDLTTGIGKDKSGIEYAKEAGIDGIISTKASLIKAAKECGIMAVQRFFVVDSRSLDMAIETLKNSKTDFVEVMPGIVPKIIERLKNAVDIPIIAGGFIENEGEVCLAVISGAYAISTGCNSLWN